jgi:hypothetical protein
MITITVDKLSEKKTLEMLSGTQKNLRKHIRGVVNRTSKRTQNFVAKLIRDEIVITARGAKQAVKLTKPASEVNLIAELDVEREDRISLKEFGARQNRKGVAYRVSKREGRKIIRSAFIVASLGGHVFLRDGAKRPALKGRYKGMMRQKIYKKQGPSLYRVVAQEERLAAINEFVGTELTNQMRDRIRFLSLPPSGD